MSSDRATTEKAKQVINPIRREIMELAHERLPASIAEQINTRYRIDAELAAYGGLRWSSVKSRLIMPIYRPNKIPIGITARSLDGAKPKTLTYIHSPDMPIGSYYINPKSMKLWVVEDQLSALRLCKHACAIALLGTHLSEGLAYDMKQIGLPHIVWCLDRDAKNKAAEYNKKYAGLAPNMSLRIPQKDPKDMTEEELIELIGSV